MTVLTATVTCPHCGHEKTETMPTNACVHFYECTGCGMVLRPKPGDCCVFCSYGSSRCPPCQNEGVGEGSFTLASPIRSDCRLRSSAFGSSCFPGTAVELH